MAKLIVNCIVTNKEKAFTGTTLQNRVNKFGSEEMVKKYYIDKDVIKLLKKGLSVSEVREKLNIKDFNKNVDIEVLYKLKCIKKGNKKRQLSPEEAEARRVQAEQNEKKYYEFQEKIKTCSKTWIEWATGNDTCIRPDIYYDYEHSKDGRCKPCPYHQHCLCTNKEVV